MLDKLKYPNTLVKKHRYHAQQNLIVGLDYPALMSEHYPVRYEDDYNSLSRPTHKQDFFNSPTSFTQAQGDQNTISESYKTKKRRDAEPGGLITFENTPPAIIDEETWNNAYLCPQYRNYTENGTMHYLQPLVVEDLILSTIQKVRALGPWA